MNDPYSTGSTLIYLAVKGLIGLLAIAIPVGVMAFSLRSKRKTERTPRIRKGTRGREFLMLRYREVRKRCWERIRRVTVPLLTISIAVVFVNLILLFVVKTNQEKWAFQGILLTCGLSLWALLFTTAWQSRKQVLLPAYYQHMLAKAQTAFGAAAREFNAILPTRGYRVAYVPEASSDSLPRLRVIAEEKRLPATLTAGVERLAQAKAELEVAEQDYDVLQTTTESKTQTT